ncbi:vanillate O-demethylase oxidoreductase VanB [Mycolicibacterium sp. (ex Dasyatis americana)]|nr:vanillate O-demethylase oxidoreductase VanB [Mycolicibacterium sp. (ex Dasyatis americana)]
MSTDRIEKEILLNAPLDRVWRAISDSGEFGRWFGVRFDGPFVAGQSVNGVITPTEVDDEVAAMQEPYAGEADAWHIVAVEAPHRLAFRWHPYAVEPGSREAAAPTTLVEFTLAEAEGGVLLRIVESGFDAIPAARRKSAFEANSEGWAHQVELVRQYLARGAAV